MAFAEFCKTSKHELTNSATSLFILLRIAQHILKNLVLNENVECFSSKAVPAEYTIFTRCYVFSPESNAL